MFFASDNWAGAHPKIAESLALEAAGYAAAYGTSDLDRRMEERFNELFQREVAVFFVGTGTAANSLALSTGDLVELEWHYDRYRAHVTHKQWKKDDLPGAA